MAQSWKQIVEEVAGPEKDVEVYSFSGGPGPPRTFTERKLRGVYDGDNEGPELLTEAGEYILLEDGSMIEEE